MTVPGQGQQGPHQGSHLTPSGHYYDCDVCGERFYGEDQARRYLREVEVKDEVEYHCQRHWRREKA